MTALSVMLLGMGTVFFGLICLIVIIKVVGLFIGNQKDTQTQTQQPSAASAAPATASDEIPNRQQFVAAVSAAIATQMDTDLSGLRIISIKKV